MNEVRYNSEKEFLKNYNPDEFEKLSITTDILIFSVANGEQDNYRKLKEKFFSVLLVKRNNYPFKDKWCLPGGFVGIKEDLEDAPKRILANETNIHNVYLEQLYTFGSINRDPRMRIVSTAYMALVDKNELRDPLCENASWFNIKVSGTRKKMVVRLDNGNEVLSFSVEKIPEKYAVNTFSYNILENNDLAFDHPLVIATGIDRLKNKITYTDIVFHMMPKYFTLGELQQVYEIILGKKLLPAAFRRIISGKVEKTDRIKKGSGHRPPLFFKYKEVV